MRVLVTGSEGFIGSHLTEYLVRGGYDVRALVQYNSFGSWGWLEECSADLAGQFEVVMGDVRDAGLVRKVMEGCDVVIHLAALIAIPYSYIAPESYVDTNIKGTLNVLKAASELEVAHVIHTSTSEVYGTAQFVPITEEHPLRGQSPYSASKIAADQMAYSYYSSFNLPLTIIRPFNTYGPRQSARAVIPTVITQILAGENQIQLGDTSTTRDFNYIDDTVLGFVAALKNSNRQGQTINIGSGYEISIGNLIDIIGQEAGVTVEVVRDKSRLRPKNSEVERLCADNSLAKKLINWEPNYYGEQGLARGIKKTIEWFVKNENKYKANIFNI